ncbi:arginine-tRNA-protein transferase [Schizophyllum amplum]|uniref:Arginyl-tRNA--protein transferase 1 n=1 Tax=Schizophyllum amplum TaxID=97359 RepID=A0A550CT81_9AGAR|nr:arginine-tRNA-protein transferase [Auriculariopsis ampla]
MTVSVGYASGASASSCGYCSPPGERSSSPSSHHSAGLDAMQLSCPVYQAMIDRGWRRSGTWCYKPDLKKSCCPQYTIKLDALTFEPSKSHRKLLRRWNNHIRHGKPGDVMDVDSSVSGGKQGKSKGLPKFSLTSAIHASESGFHDIERPAHTFETILEPSAFTDEKYALYEKYQQEIHHDTGNTPRGFKRFLVSSPLRGDPIPYSSPPSAHLPKTYGSYHQMYRVDGKLIAMAVLDILPKCVSSVYFMYDKDWEAYSLGKLSAMREACLAREMHEAGAKDMAFLYMGFYIYSCQKMRYKGEYAPSYLADPETYDWYPLAQCKNLLEKNRYACFAHRDHSVEGDFDREDPPPELPSEDDQADIQIVGEIVNGVLLTVPLKNYTAPYSQQELAECIDGLGLELAKQVVFAIY